MTHTSYEAINVALYVTMREQCQPRDDFVPSELHCYVTTVLSSRFNNGIAYGYIKGDTLVLDDFRDEKILR